MSENVTFDVTINPITYEIISKIKVMIDKAIYIVKDTKTLTIYSIPFLFKESKMRDYDNQCVYV